MFGMILGTKPYRPQPTTQRVEKDSWELLQECVTAMSTFGKKPYFTEKRVAESYRMEWVQTLQSILPEHEAEVNQYSKEFNSINIDEILITEPILEVTINTKMRKKLRKKVEKFLNKKPHNYEEVREFYQTVLSDEIKISEKETGVHESDWWIYASVGDFHDESYELELSADTMRRDLSEYLGDVEVGMWDAIDEETTEQKIEKIETPVTLVTKDSGKVKTHWRLW